MPADKVFADDKAFAAELRDLRWALRGRVKAGRVNRVRRTALTRKQRTEILGKTNGRCHICGGLIDGNNWDADHILAHAAGGMHAVDNYLPAHSLCNSYRRHFEADEFQWILKIGVWVRTEIANETKLGQLAGKGFWKHEQSRARRRKPTKTQPVSVGSEL